MWKWLNRREITQINRNKIPGKKMNGFKRIQSNWILLCGILKRKRLRPLYGADNCINVKKRCQMSIKNCYQMNMKKRISEQERLLQERNTICMLLLKDCFTVTDPENMETIFEILLR